MEILGWIYTWIIWILDILDGSSGLSGSCNLLVIGSILGLGSGYIRLESFGWIYS